MSKKIIRTLYGVRSAVLNAGGHLEQCFRWGAKEWCPWMPNPDYPGIRKLVDPSDENIVFEIPHSEFTPHGVHDLESLITWANKYFQR